MRKKIKEIKRIKLKNKKILKKYPWLTPVNVWTGKLDKDYDYSYTLADEIPRGWLKAFGWQMIDEINEVLKKTRASITVEQIKEKYGRLEFYCAAPEEVQRIISDYGCISENICINCGTPDVPMTGKGYVLPMCEKCYCKETEYRHFTHEDFMEFIKDDNFKIPNSYTVRHYNTKDGYKDEVRDISDKVSKIRNRYNKRIKKHL